MIKDSVRIKREKAVKKIFTDEPTCDYQLTDSAEDRLWCIKAYNWYAEQETSQEVLIEYLVDYLKTTEQYKNYAKKIGGLAKYKVPVLVCQIARMLSRGILLSPKTVAWFHKGVDDLIKITEKPARAVASNFRERVVNAVNDKANFILSELEVNFDQMVDAGYSNFNCYQFLKDSEANPKSIKVVLEELNPRLAEIKLAQSDAIARGWYRTYSTAELADLHEVFSNTIKDLELYAQHAKTAAKVKRVTKVTKKTRGPKKLIKKKILKKKA